jgi:chaperonin GroES
MSKKIRPIGDRVMVRIDAADTKIGSILIPDCAREENPKTGEVVALGVGDFEVKIGDKVLVKQYNGLPVEVDGQLYRIYLAQDILAVLG